MLTLHLADEELELSYGADGGRLMEYNKTKNETSAWSK